jgi:hypothetical protein
MVHGVGFIVGMDIGENDIVRVSWMYKENVRVGGNDGFCYDVGMIQCSYGDSANERDSYR